MSRAVSADDRPFGGAARRDHPRAGAEARATGSADLRARTGHRLSVVLIGLTLFALALAPRLLGLDLFPTSDEDSWMRRAGGFTYGLLNGQLGRTYQNGHPGVTTMWTALLTLGPEQMVRYADRVHNQRLVGQVPGYLEALAGARVGFAVLATVGTVVAALLVWRLFGREVALLAGGGLALEPFLIANAQLVHVDGPLATFVTVSALAALVRALAGGGRAFIVLSGVAAGLALLSKTPALFLVGFVPALWVAGNLSAARNSRKLAVDLLVWLLIAAVTIVALWPAIWALGPVEVLGRVVGFARETGGQPDEVGSFFFGQVGADPGPLYYPVATLFRLSPFVVLGLLALTALAGRLGRAERARAGWLALFALGFALMMTLGPKKFDRYLLPIFPALVALAALGWWLALARVAARPVSRVALGGGLFVLAVWPLASTYPYPLSYYNGLLGGGPAAARAVMIGNGEGLDRAAAWIAAQPDAPGLRVAAHSFDILAAMIPGDGEPLREGVPDDADYIVTYGRRIQMQRWGRSLERYFESHPPVHTVWINGIEYARIHEGPRRIGES